MHFVYIVRCADGTLYTGYARDPGVREKMHNRGRGARYTAGRRPVRLVYSEAFTSIGDALRRERQLKRLRRARKEALLTLNPAAPSSRPSIRRPIRASGGCPSA
jgi:putative endonuclease